MALKVASLVIWRVKWLTGFVHKPLPFKYLGAPIYADRRKLELFNPLVEVIAVKVSKLVKKVLSYEGRIQLIQLVILSMPIHLLYVLKPPKTGSVY
ncbi:UNVERIFIED_CONTAM: hypothetical protein Sradi_2969100 [Sesamum radiatum]|uniref:Uncharacterized protein n=1 Tax=Sesamum radiatum TaxID=300843 RepID=A0AAW2S083_SESRA